MAVDDLPDESQQRKGVLPPLSLASADGHVIKDPTGYSLSISMASISSRTLTQVQTNGLRNSGRAILSLRTATSGSAKNSIAPAIRRLVERIIRVPGNSFGGRNVYLGTKRTPMDLREVSECCSGNPECSRGLKIDQMPSGLRVHC